MLDKGLDYACLTTFGLCMLDKGLDCMLDKGLDYACLTRDWTMHA